MDISDMISRVDEAIDQIEALPTFSDDQDLDHLHRKVLSYLDDLLEMLERRRDA